MTATAGPRRPTPPSHQSPNGAALVTWGTAAMNAALGWRAEHGPANPRCPEVPRGWPHRRPAPSPTCSPGAVPCGAGELGAGERPGCSAHRARRLLPTHHVQPFPLLSSSGLPETDSRTCEGLARARSCSGVGGKGTFVADGQTPCPPAISLGHAGGWGCPGAGSFCKRARPFVVVVGAPPSPYPPSTSAWAPLGALHRISYLRVPQGDTSGLYLPMHRAHQAHSRGCGAQHPLQPARIPRIHTRPLCGSYTGG